MILLAALGCMASQGTAVAQEAEGAVWNSVTAKSGGYSVAVPCTFDDAEQMAVIAQKHVPAAMAMTVDFACYSDTALFTAQTASIKNPQNRFADIWSATGDQTLVHVTLGDGRRAIDTQLMVDGNEVSARYLELSNGGFVALSVQRLALDDIKQDAAKFFGSFQVATQ